MIIIRWSSRGLTDIFLDSFPVAMATSKQWQRVCCPYFVFVSYILYSTFCGQVVEALTLHILGSLIAALYYNTLGYVLAQVVSLVFRKQNQTLHLCQNITYIIVIETADESTQYVFSSTMFCCLYQLYLVTVSLNLCQICFCHYIAALTLGPHHF